MILHSDLHIFVGFVSADSVRKLLCGVDATCIDRGYLKTGC
jgi:hypothetical protein